MIERWKATHSTELQCAYKSTPLRSRRTTRVPEQQEKPQGTGSGRKMLVRVELVGPSDAPASSVEIECGAGEQILRWIGYTACARLAMDESNLMGIYVPKSISDKHGTLLDPNFVVNEVVKDQQTLVVEFGSGPEAFSAHLAPDTPEEATGPNAPSAGHAHGQEAPPSSWSQAGWLESMDLSLYGMQEFISKEIIQSKPEMVTKVRTVPPSSQSDTEGIPACRSRRHTLDARKAFDAE